MVVIMLASMVAISLMYYLRAEETAAAAGTGSEQAWAAAMSGIYEAMRIAGSMTPGSADWLDDPATFRDRFLCDDGADRWYFTVYAPGEVEGQQLRYGLEDESARLNINKATPEMIAKLPGLTSYLAQGLADFLDADSTPNPEGAEQEYYDTLAKPYAVRNGPLSSLEELLLVRGFTPLIVYGEDANANFQLDANENDGDALFPPDNGDGKLDGGLRRLLTVHSYSLNEDPEGLPRIDLNNANDPLPEKDFPPALAQYITELRKANTTLKHPAELLGAKMKIKNEQGQEVEIESGVGKGELAMVLEYFTTSTDYYLPGLVNINTAPAAVLKTLPGIDEAKAENIVGARSNLTAEQRRTPAWLFEEELVDAAQFIQLAPLLTARAYQFHVQVVGYGVPSGRYRVLEAVIDTAGVEPSITYLRDITRLGLPFAIQTGSEESWEDLDFFGAAPRKSAPARLAAGTARPNPRGGITAASEQRQSRATAPALTRRAPTQEPPHG